MGWSQGQQDVPKTVLIISGFCDNYFIVLEDFDILFFENIYAIIVAYLSNRYERSIDETVQNVALFCAYLDRLGDRGTVPLRVVVLSVPFGANTVGPELVLVISEQNLE